MQPCLRAILPKYVRLDERLTFCARVIFAEIYSNINSWNYCELTNNFFIKNYKLSERAVYSTLEKLEECNYIKVKRVLGKRRIYVINHEVIEDEEPKLEISYVVNNKKINSAETLISYFEKKLDFVSKNLYYGLSEKIKNGIRTIYLNLTYTAFDESFLTKKIAGELISSELIEYIINYVEFYSLLPLVNKLADISDINNIQIYILASLVNLYKEEFKTFKENKTLWKDKFKNKHYECKISDEIMENINYG